MRPIREDPTLANMTNYFFHDVEKTVPLPNGVIDRVDAFSVGGVWLTFHGSQLVMAVSYERSKIFIAEVIDSVAVEQNIEEVLEVYPNAEVKHLERVALQEAAFQLIIEEINVEVNNRITG